MSVSSALTAGHADWSGSKTLSALERTTVGGDGAPKPDFQGDEPPEPGDSAEPEEPVEPEEPAEPEDPTEPEEPVEPDESAEPEASADPAESERASEPASAPETGTGLRAQQVTVSVFLAVVVVLGALLAVAYRRR